MGELRGVYHSNRPGVELVPTGRLWGVGQYTEVFGYCTGCFRFLSPFSSLWGSGFWL